MENGRSGSYYAVLGVRPDASCSEIRRAYRKLAMKWHPDRCGREPWAVDEAKRRFQQIQEAYQVLSDEGKRTLYDAGLYDPFEEDEEVEGFSDFVQEMVNLMSNVRKEEKECSLEELQRMLGEMAQGFDAAPPFSSQCFDSGGSDSNRNAKRFRCDEDPMARRSSHVHVSGFEEDPMTRRSSHVHVSGFEEDPMARRSSHIHVSGFEEDPMARRSSHIHVSGFKVFGSTASY